MPECQFCGSTACEWDGPDQLGCADCGYEAADRSNRILGPAERQAIADAIDGIDMARCGTRVFLGYLDAYLDNA